MAPEMVRRESYSEKVDLWALGVLAYVLLVGFPPFGKEGNDEEEEEEAEEEEDGGIGMDEELKVSSSGFLLLSGPHFHPLTQPRKTSSMGK
jgi:serine/threonine protein kinase